MSNPRNGRRDFIALASAVLFSGVSTTDLESQPEVPTYWVDLPAHTTFWGVLAFMSDTMVEVTLATNAKSQSFRGRFDGKRLVEFSWANQDDSRMKIGIRAVAVGDGRELPVSRVNLLGSEGGTDNVVLAFGRRGTPSEAKERHGSYPFEAVLLGFAGFQRVI
jgi:hypothetical protein